MINRENIMNDQIDQLAKLNDLKSSGAITQEEFAEQKKKLLQPAAVEVTPKKSFLPLRSLKTWVILIVATIGYQAIKHGIADSDKLPTCQSEQARNMVVELINKQVRENPLAALVVGGARVISISSTKELHSDPAIRACEGVVKRNDGVGEVGFTIEMGDKEKGEFWVHTYDVAQVRAIYDKTEVKSALVAAKQEPNPVAEQANAETVPLHPENQPEAKKVLSNTHTKCMEQEVTMPGMIQCSDEEAQRQDARLNAAYKAAMTTVVDKNGLKTAQRQWIKERDKECAVDESGGQNANLISSDCIAIKTAARADEIEKTK